MTHDSKSNIVLVGFMGSGKSRIGQKLADTLGFALIDIDAQIEQEQGKSIKDLFSEKGEWFFRELEAKAIADLRDKKSSIIVTGGGAPMHFANVAALKELGEIFFLDASFPLIVERLRKSSRRPLGKAATALDLARLKALYTHRRPVYANVGYRIDVNHQDKSRTCNEIIERFNALGCMAFVARVMVEDVVSNYPIYFQAGVVRSINKIILALGLKDFKPVVITSDKLQGILEASLKNIVNALGADAPIITISDGEKYKNLDAVFGIIDGLFNLGLTRKTLIIALGGGNVGDVAGFAASIFLRGVPFIQIPTTLLSMVDASIGGKTGVDIPLGKNLVGSFYQPKAVIIDTDFLVTLPKEEVACGMAEIIKHAIIGDPGLFSLLKDGDPDLNAVIERALKVKADIVFNDPFESNIRAYLNLGHTFAHAIEKVSHYQIKHGHAVAMGLVLATSLAHRLGILREDFLLELKQLLTKYDLPVAMPKQFDRAELLSAMKYDKKRDPAGLKLVLPKKIGEVCLQYVSEQDIFETTL